MGLLDLFKPNPTQSLGGNEDTGFGLPKLFNDDTRARLGVLGSNLIAAGFGNSPNAGAVIELGQLGDKRKEQKRLQAAAKRYADKIRSKNPDLAEAIDADYTLITTIMGEDIKQKNAIALSKFEHDQKRGPFGKMMDEYFTEMGGGGTPVSPPPYEGGGAVAPNPLAVPPPSGKSDFGPVGPPAVGEPEVYQDSAIAPEASFQDAVYRPGVTPVQSTAPVQAPQQVQQPVTKEQKILDFVRRSHPEYTNEEAMRWARAASSGDESLIGTVENQIQSDKEYNQTAAAALKAKDLEYQRSLEATKQAQGFTVQQDEEKAAREADAVADANRVKEEIAAKSGKDFTASLPGLASPRPGGPLLGTPAEIRHRQISQKFGLIGTKKDTPLITGGIDAAAQAGPEQLAVALRNVADEKTEKVMPIREDYYMKEDGTQGLIEGSKTWKEEKANEGKRAETKKMQTVRQEVILEDLQDAIDMTEASDWTDPATGFGAETLAEAVGGSTAADVAQLLASVKANIGFDRLQEMKSDPDNKTGGALGQVAVQELNYLQSVMGSLDQKASKPMLLKRMKRLKKIYDGLSDRSKHFLMTGETDGGEGDTTTIKSKYKDLKLE